tara:strand:- start:212 stop:1630 length:1419 start_codon:yes stop_codon:yes gene_type:complete
MLKPSQVGASSYLICDMLVDTIFTPGTTSVIVAHEEFITQRLLTKAQAFYDSIPEEFKPPMAHRGSHEKSFPDIHSVFYIGSARAFTFGRGDAIHNFLADEYAFWPDTSKIMVPTLQRVPAQGRVMVLSTPNGEDNDFHDLYYEGKSNESNWQSHFYHWREHPEYAIFSENPLSLPADRTDTLTLLTDLEIQLLRDGATNEQIRWRRYKVAEMAALKRRGDTISLFPQEFPEDEVTCFLIAGDMVYDPDEVDRMARECIEAPRSRSLLSGFPATKTLIWEQPQEQYDYMVGVDPGQGKHTETCISVWRFEYDEETDIETPIFVARCSGLIEPDETSEQAIAIGRYYNTASISVEGNGHGMAVLSGVRGYPRLYHRTQIDSGRRTRSLGWITSNKTKPFMIGQVQKLMADMVCRDIRTVSQFRNIRWVESARGEKIAQAMGADDLHDGAAIAIACRDVYKGTKGYVGSTEGWD